uniref:Cadherin domain-containing protein n=1 Tax=Electrophorus electricus TaxID=8005 RepID=A0AAY5EIG3_ELEEL
MFKMFIYLVCFIQQELLDTKEKNGCIQNFRFPLPSAFDSDVGSNSVKTYKLSANDHFTLDVHSEGEHSHSVELVLQKTLDREKEPVIQLTLTAVDGGKPARSGTLQIVVNVEDVNDNVPVFSRTIYKARVTENALHGTSVIAVHATDLDEDQNGEISYSFVNQNNDKQVQAFAIDSKTGLITVRGAVDFETQSAVEIRVQAKDKGHKPRAALYINDNTPEISITSLVNTVREDVQIDTPVGMVTVIDKDSGKNGQVKLKILGSVPFKIESSYKNYYTLVVNGPLDRESASQYNVTLIAADEGTPSLSTTMLQKALDREKQPVIQLTLTAVDGGKPARSGTMTIVINVLDVNDNIPVFSKSLYKARVHENAQPGTPVITVHASDSDEGMNGDIIYTFVNHDNGNVNAFAIHPEKGEIVVTGDIDYERKNAVELRVQAKDKGHNPRAALCKVLVEIIDVNDNIPEISVTSLVSTIREDAPVETTVGMITVIDNDAGKNGQVTLDAIGSVPFKIQKSYKNYYTLVVNGPLDRESASEHKIIITAADGGTPPLSSTSVITVHVSDVNDNAPRFAETTLNVYVKENNPVGAVVYTVSAFDSDVGDNARITYSIQSSKKSPITSIFNINSDSGNIHSLQSFNYEEIKTFQFKVQANDAGVPPLNSTVTLNVFILDENDNSPGVLAPYSEHAGYFVTKIRAVDADSGYNALLSYHISEPKGNNLFRIGTSSGEIRTKRRMSDNDLKTHPLVIMVSDNGEPSLSATVSIDVVVAESGIYGTTANTTTNNSSNSNTSLFCWHCSCILILSSLLQETLFSLVKSSVRCVFFIRWECLC